jgi:biopolymer transport protein ExbB
VLDMPLSTYLLHWLEFMQKGGPVMWLIAAMALVLWSLIFERLWYVLKGFDTDIQYAVQQWVKNKSEHAKSEQSFRLLLTSDLVHKLDERLPLIKSLIALCPLLGLLGTVSGMIAVFDVIAFTSMGDIKLMASGVSQATIPTMSSMVVAISGIFALWFLQKRTNTSKQMISDHFNGGQHA